MIDVEKLREQQVIELLDLTDQDLMQKIIHYGFYKSEFTELIQNICNSTQKLSNKQRKCLAIYLTKNFKYE